MFSDVNIVNGDFQDYTIKIFNFLPTQPIQILFVEKPWSRTSQAWAPLNTVQTVNLILPCIERIPQMHSCIEKKFCSNLDAGWVVNLCSALSKQVGTEPWFESRT